MGLLASLGGGLVAGWLVFRASPPIYASTSYVVVANAADVDLQTQAQIVRSSQTAAEAGKLLHSSAPPSLPDVEVLSNSSVLLIRYEAETPDAAQAGSR